MFREQSLAVKIFSLFVFSEGKKYVKKLLAGFIEKIDNAEPLEINPDACSSVELLQSNRERLKECVTELMDSIWNSLDKLPASFQFVAMYLKKHVGEKFPDDVYNTFAGFFFLRFLVPCLVTPTAFDIIEDVKNSHTRRSLILVGKLVTNLANRVHFGEKEKFMLMYNEWLDKQDKSLTLFFDSLSHLQAKEMREHVPSIRKRSIYNDLHSFVHR